MDEWQQHLSTACVWRCYKGGSTAWSADSGGIVLTVSHLYSLWCSCCKVITSCWNWAGRGNATSLDSLFIELLFPQPCRDVTTGARFQRCHGLWSRHINKCSAADLLTLLRGLQLMSYFPRETFTLFFADIKKISVIEGFSHRRHLLNWWCHFIYWPVTT